MINVCLCTHNPRLDLLQTVLDSIQNQETRGEAFDFLIVDNGSSPPINQSFLKAFSDRGIAARLISEPVLGISRARLRAITETDGEWLLFVDDDNELMPNYIYEGIKFAKTNEDIGCFGGKLLLPPALNPSSWVKPFLPYLAIKEIGDEPLIGKSEYWEPWEPPTAGAFINRKVLERYRRLAEGDITTFKLGRTGKKNLSSCEDSLIMRGAFPLNLANAYNPNMILHHHLDIKRFNFKYLIRLMYSYGVSHVVLESLLNSSHNIPPYYLTFKEFIKLIKFAYKEGAKQSVAFGIGMVAYHFGTRNQHFKQLNTK